MAKSREIKKRIKAVKNIQRITRTMQMIATSKFSRAQQAATAGKPYAHTLLDLVAEIAGSGAGEDGLRHSLLGNRETEAQRSVPRELTLVLTSERGLCGPYNGNVVRAAVSHLKSLPDSSGERHRLEVVGKKGVNVLRFSRFKVDEQLFFGDSPRYEEVERLGQRYIDAFSAGEFDVIRVVSMEYLSAGRQRPRVLQLLPFAPAGGDEKAAAGTDAKPAAPTNYEFSPSADELLDTLLPMAVKSVLFQAINEAIVSEHIARMIAMKSATDNAKAMGKALKTRFNRARQSQITTELTEIVSGAAALG